MPVYNLYQSAVTSTGYSTHYEISEKHKIESVQIVIGNSATVKVQVTNEQSPTNWEDLTSGTTASAMYSVGRSYRHIRAATTAYSSGSVDVYVNHQRNN